jgi:hypothetical protein
MMIEAAKVIVPIGEGKEIEARVTATGLIVSGSLWVE